MAENTKSPRKSRAKTPKAAAAAPAQTADETNAAGAAASENNPASTTSAADPERDTPEAAAAAAAASGTNDPANNPPAAAEGEVLEPASPDKPLEDAAAGNRHSHPAQTTAEATIAAQAGDTTAALNMGGNMPAGEAADPNGPAGDTTGGDNAAFNDAEVLQSTQVEDGSVQDAVREAIGAGTGAPDGIGDVGEDPSAGDVVEPVEAAPGVTFVGGKAKLWPLLEKGGSTIDELNAAAGHRSTLWTIYLMARQAGREIVVSKDRKTGAKTYGLKAAPKKSAK